MSRLNQFILAVSLLAASLLFVFIGSFPWLAWHSLPVTADLRITLSGRLLPEIVTSVEARELLGESKDFLADSYTVSFARTGDSEMMMVLPKLLHYKSLQEKLQAEGYLVVRKGIFLQAEKKSGSNRLTGDFDFYAYIKTVIGTPVPLTPTLIAEIKSQFFGFDSDLSLLGVRNKGQLTIMTAGRLDDIQGESKITEMVESGQLTMRASGSVLQQMPETLQGAWDKQLHAVFQLDTKPKIIRYVSQYENINITIEGGDAGLAVIGAGDAFIQAATEWIQEHERRQRPVRSAFRLPDGTLGYEYVPGDPALVSEEAQDGCRAPLDGRNTLWLCQGDNGASLGTSHHIAEKSLTKKENDWYITFETNTLTHTLECNEETRSILCSVKKVTATGSGQESTWQITTN